MKEWQIKLIDTEKKTCYHLGEKAKTKTRSCLSCAAERDPFGARAFTQTADSTPSELRCGIKYAPPGSPVTEITSDGNFP